MNLALFDLDNTLLAGDSDFEWAQFLIDRGVLDREVYEVRNQRFYDQYKAGTLDIREFLDFQLKPLSRHPRAVLDAWHGEYMRERILPMIRDSARALVGQHRDEVRVIITATNSFVTAPIARAFGIGLDLGVGNSLQIVAAKRDEGVGDHRRLRRGRAVLGVGIGDAAEILERAQIVLGDAVALGVHPAKFPLRDRVTVLGRVLQGGQRIVGGGGLAQCTRGTDRRRGGRHRHPRAISCQGNRTTARGAVAQPRIMPRDAQGGRKGFPRSFRQRGSSRRAHRA